MAGVTRTALLIRAKRFVLSLPPLPHKLDVYRWCPDARNKRERRPKATLT
jgi:hypothetical protein